MSNETKESISEEQVSTKNKPVAFINGNNKLVEWRNKNEEGFEYSKFKLEKIYKDSEGKWASTNSFDYNDLYKIYHLIGDYLKKNVRKLE